MYIYVYKQLKNCRFSKTFWQILCTWPAILNLFLTKYTKNCRPRPNDESDTHREQNTAKGKQCSEMHLDLQIAHATVDATLFHSPNDQLAIHT